SINDGFLQKLAAQHHGTSCLLSPQDDIVGAVARLGCRLRRPVLTGIRVSNGWELAGKDLADLYAAETLCLPLRAKRVSGSEGPNVVVVDGKLPDATAQSYRFELVETSAMALPLLWAKQRIDFLLAKGQ